LVCAPKAQAALNIETLRPLPSPQAATTFSISIRTSHGIDNVEKAKLEITALYLYDRVMRTDVVNESRTRTKSNCLHHCANKALFSQRGIFEIFSGMFCRLFARRFDANSADFCLFISALDDLLRERCR
jgi:hypothetical protein